MRASLGASDKAERGHIDPLVLPTGAGYDLLHWPRKPSVIVRGLRRGVRASGIEIPPATICEPAIAIITICRLSFPDGNQAPPRVLSAADFDTVFWSRGLTYCPVIVFSGFHSGQFWH
jgi:hypothetical protein